MRNFLIGFGVFVALLAGGLYFGWMQVNQWLHNPFAQQDMSVPQKSVVQIKPGQTFAAVTTELAQLNIVEHPQIFNWYARVNQQATKIRVGEYHIASHETPISLLQRFVDGDVVHYSLTFVEGWTVAQALAVLASNDKITHKLKQADVENYIEQLGLPAQHGEGLLFPDTYRFRRGDSDISILLRAYQKMQRELNQAWDGRAPNLKLKTPYDLLILASIVEKETGRDEDRQTVSQVFNTRLQRNMLLQTDPTIIYGLGSSYAGDIKRIHLKQDTPYNTYLHKGLTPTPIALPGRRSLDSAANPADTRFLYFVARGDGSSKFSTTLMEHQAAVRRFQMR